MMAQEEETGNSSHSNPTSSRAILTTIDDVAKEIKEWMKSKDSDVSKKLSETFEHIELNLDRPLTCLESTCAEKQYVKTVLELWLEKSLEKAYEYLEYEETNICNEMACLLSQLDSIKSYEDICFELNDAASPLRNWYDGECRYLQLIIEQKDLFKYTPRFTAVVKCYFQQFKTSCIAMVFSRCLSDIFKDETHGEKHKIFIIDLNKFLSNINEEKNLQDILEKEEIFRNYILDENITGQDLMTKLAEIFICTEAESRKTVSLPEWLQTFLSHANSLGEDEWTRPLQVLTKETCKRFLLPETEIELEEENGKQIISIRGVAIFVSKMMEKMNRLKNKHPNVEEIKITGLNSVQIDCDLDNDTWHGINIGIVTDKLIVGGVNKDESAQTLRGVCWNVSGKNAITNQPKGVPRQSGESGGNVRVACNYLINGQKWTILSDGGHGSAAYKWTREEFEKSFPSMSTGGGEEATETVLKTLEEIVPKENRTRGKDILPGHKGNFVINGRSNDGSEITVIFHQDNNEQETLISIRRSNAGQGGYGGNITIECFGNGEMHNISGESLITSGIPFTGKDTRRKPLKSVRMGVHEASCPNGMIGKVTGDVAFIHKVKNGSTKDSGTFYGLEKDEGIEVSLDLVVIRFDSSLYVKHGINRYAKLSLFNYSEIDDWVKPVHVVKTKAIIREKLVFHLDQIDERKQLTKCIQKILSNPKNAFSNRIEETISEMEKKVHQLHQLITQRQQYQFERIQQEQYVRTATNPSRSFPKPKIIGRRPLWYDEHLNKNATKSVYCLDILLTKDDIGSVLHCLLGKMNSEGIFVCRDTNKFRKRMAKHIREKDLSDKIYNGVVMFVLRVNDDGKNFPVAIEKRKKLIDSFKEKYQQLKGMDSQLLCWLNHNNDYDKKFIDSNDLDKWNKVWFNCNADPKRVKEELLKEQGEWETDKDLKEEYAKYIESPTGTLGLAELEILTEVLKRKIHVFKHHGSSYFLYKETLFKRESSSSSDFDSDSDSHQGPLKDSEYFILYEGNGRWKRLALNHNLNMFCSENFFNLKTEEKNCNPTHFAQLKSWIAEKKEIDKMNEVNTSIKKFDSDNDKTPDKLSRLLFERLNKLNNICQINQLMETMCSLAEWVEYYNIRKISPFFYLSIVESNEPNEWNCEFILLEMEERLEKPWANKEERHGWRKKVIDNLISHDQLLPLFTKIATKTEEIDIYFSLNLNKLLRMLTVLEEEKCNTTDVGYTLFNFFYKQRSQFYEQRVNDWSKSGEINELTEEKKNEYINLLLDLEYRNEIELLQKLANNTTRPARNKNILQNTLLQRISSRISGAESRNVEAIIYEMKKKIPENFCEEVMTKSVNIVNESKLKILEFKKGIETIVKTLIEKNPEKYKILKIFLKEEQSGTDTTEKTPKHPGTKRLRQTLLKITAIPSSNKKKKEEMTISQQFHEIIFKKAKKLDAEDICNKIAKLIRDGLDLKDNASLTNFLCVFDYVVERTMGFSLRDTQRITIITLLVNIFKENTLAQVSTGEGKSIIVAGVAIGFALYKTKTQNKRRNSKVDVITSNDVLALRDSSLPVVNGGLKELYEFFNVTVAHNCSQSEENRKNAYNMDVVYGQLANFQRDYLLDEIYNRNIKGDRWMEFVIIDEVDCMLLDRGNNMLYLSHDIPGMEMLESLYVFIWEQIRDTSPETNEIKEQIKSSILYDLYGQITKEDLNCIYAPLGQEELALERTSIWEHLIEKTIIDRQGRLLINDIGEITEEKINYIPRNTGLKEKQLNCKIIFYLRTIAERKRRICIPSHLLEFVDRHLDTWLDNARRALELKQDEDYVIDQNRSDTSPDLNPQVIIIDPDTGTDQPNSQWDGALHQFLQLKEGCKLTLQSLKSVFISNTTYIKAYNKLTGVSGTLGFQQEQEFLKNKYNCDFITIPTAFLKRFSPKPAKLLKTKENWHKAVTEETRETIKNRSIVIFCRSIKEVNQVHKRLKSTIRELRDDNKRIHRYTRDYEKLEFENKPLDIGHIIITTNLAGRGTDIKISENLKNNGGLHICLTYFPENERVEEQAMGRAARKGEPGSGILILCESQTDHQEEESGTSGEWGVEKMFIMKETREWKERQRISRLEKDLKHIEKLEKLFTNSNGNLSAKEVNTATKENQSKTVRQLDHAVLFKVIHDSILDKWALWLDETEYDFKCFNLKQLKFIIDLPKFIIGTPKGLIPARRVTMAKHLAMTKSSKKGNQNLNSEDIATTVFNELIFSHDNSFYPAAFYYYAFILLKEEKLKKDEFVRTLRNTETILNRQIDMQNSFIQIHQSERKSDQSHSFCTVDGYKKQKNTNIKILQHFLGTIQWLLGSRCSVPHLREAGNDNPKVDGFFAKSVKNFQNFIENKKIKKDEELKKHKIRLEKVDEYFRELIKSKCIVCQLNNPNTIPSESVEKSTFLSNKIRSKIILQIADDYGVSSLLEEKLKLVFDEGLNEEDIEKKLKKEIEDKMKDHYLNPSTRKAFWKELVKVKALNPLKECINTECVILSEKQLEELGKKSFEIDRRKEIKLDFGVKTFDPINNSLYVLYNPTYDNKQQLEAAGKLMFSKEYVKRVLFSEYNERKTNFESNKIAQLDLTKLKDVNLDSFGQLAMDDLDRINIDHSEQKGIWEQLVNQKIINDHGFLEPGYDLTKEMRDPECPVYADAVMRLVRKKFIVEIVKQQWLKIKDNPNCLKAINLLPRKLYRDMLADLMAAHVISGALVTANFAINFKEEIDKITESEQERECLMQFLTSRQSVFIEKLITPEFILDFIERDMKFHDELYDFRLAGFDRVIGIKDRKWTSKRIFIASLFTPLIITGGLASVGVAAALTYLNILSLGFSKNLFFIGGFSDILYAVETILSHKDFTWADYGRQRIRSATGKIEPIDAIKAIWKLSGSSNQSVKAITTEHKWKKQADQNPDRQNWL